jgi:hypothetical protein
MTAMTETIEPIPVDIVRQSAQAERQSSAELGSWQSYQIPIVSAFPSGAATPQPILSQDEKRWRAVILNVPVTQSVASPSQPAVPASTVAQQNTNLYPVNVTLSGFTATAVFVNGIQVGTTNGTYQVPAGGAISVTYTVAGTWTWANAAAPAVNPVAYVLVGSLRQIQNGQGGRLGVGQTITIENQQAVYCVSDGINAATVTVLNERYSVAPHDINDHDYGT